MTTESTSSSTNNNIVFGFLDITNDWQHHKTMIGNPLEVARAAIEIFATRNSAEANNSFKTSKLQFTVTRSMLDSSFNSFFTVEKFGKDFILTIEAHGIEKRGLLLKKAELTGAIAALVIGAQYVDEYK